MKKSGSKRGGKRKQKRRGIQAESGDKALVACSSGMSYVIGKVTPLGFLRTRSDEWNEWHEDEAKDGWVLHKEGQKKSILVTRDEFRQVLGAFLKSGLEALEALDPVQRHFPTELDKLKKVEGRLRKPFWKSLRNTSPTLYATLVRSIMRNKENKGHIERVDADLGKFGLCWQDLRTAERLSASRLALGRVGRSIASEKEKSGTKRWRRYDRAVKYISSGTSPFGENLKKNLLKEHEKAKALAPFERSTAEAFRENVRVAVREIVGDDAHHVKIRSPWDAITSSVLSIVIVRMADEILAAGSSKRRAFILCDWILHLASPFHWLPPDKYSAARVRQRYYYWSKKLKA
jgi:hypothetical protein